MRRGGESATIKATPQANVAGSVNVDGAERVRQLLRHFAAMFLQGEDVVVMEALVQLEENCREGEFGGIAVRSLSFGLQLSEKTVLNSLSFLVKAQLVHVLARMEDDEIERKKERRRRLARRARRKRKAAEAGKGPTGVQEDVDDDDDFDDGDDAEVTESSSSSSSSDGSMDGEEDDEKALRYAVDYRSVVRVALWYFRATFAPLCCVPVPKTKDNFLTASKGSKKEVKIEKGLRCLLCDTYSSPQSLKNGSRCESCGTDLVNQTLLHSWRSLTRQEATTSGAKTNGGQNSSVADAIHFVVPAPFIDDRALLVQGLHFAALLHEPFVALQDDSMPLTRGEDVMTVTEVKQLSKQSASAQALKYRPLNHITPQLISIPDHEAAATARVHNKLRRQADIPPWLRTATHTFDESPLASGKEYFQDSPAVYFGIDHTGHRPHHHHHHHHHRKRPRDHGEDEGQQGEPLIAAHLLGWLDEERSGVMKDEWERVEIPTQPHALLETQGQGNVKTSRRRSRSKK